MHGTPDYRFCPCCGHALDRRSLKHGEPDRLCCAGCEFVFYLDPKVAAGVVLHHADGIVLLQRAIEPAYGAWVFPGGFVDRGEHPAEAAIREAREEAGVDVELDGVVGIYNHPPGSPVVLIVYHGRIVSGVPEALDESLAVGFYPPEAVPWEDLAFSTTRLALGDYVRCLGKDAPFSR
jgi:ADP-ribose pyrophosphatase YjhB (NUDIX family)